jgi:hypothetical protein
VVGLGELIAAPGLTKGWPAGSIVRGLRADEEMMDLGKLKALSIVPLLALASCEGPWTSPVVVKTVRVPGPVKTVTKIKMVPGPIRTVVKIRVVTRTIIRYVSRSLVRAPVPVPTPIQASSSPTGGAAACIRFYESGDNYQAQNPSSSASGAYQFLDSTWQAVTGLAGRAMNYSPATQDAAFWKLWAGGAGRSQWVTGYHC